METLIIYDDSEVFGGHQVMALEILRSISTRYQIVYFINPKNNKYLEKLSAVKLVHSLEIRMVCPPLRKIYSHYAFNKCQTVKKLTEEFTSIHPSRILIMQGDIMGSVHGLVAAKKTNISVGSYIACPHKHSAMGAKAGWLRDFLNRSLYKLPDFYITISNSMKEILVDCGAVAPIHIVFNRININHKTSRSSLREELKIPKSKKIIGLVGRFENKQKSQLWLLDQVLQNPTFWKDKVLVLAGDGPDNSSIQDKIAKYPLLQNSVRVMNWCDDMPSLYSILDLLVIPSRFEGVPLVMLESLSSGIPVVATARDGMKDVLPKEWTFNRIDSRSTLKERLGYFRNRISTKFEKHSPAVRNALYKAMDDALTHSSKARIVQREVITLTSNETFNKKLASVF